MDDAPAHPPETAESSDGLINRLRQRGGELAQGRRLVVPLPGWEDVGEGRGLWARFTPLSRRQQTTVTWSDGSTELDLMAPMLAECCEEILIGTRGARSPLADEPDVASQRASAGPLRFDADLGTLLGTGGSDGASVIKRMLVRGDDDLPFFAVAGELLRWSGEIGVQGVEQAAGE